MCGCKRNRKAVNPVIDPLKTADTLVAEGIAIWAQFNGPRAMERRVPGTSTRYRVDPTRCVLMLKEHYQAFHENNAGEFVICEGTVDGKSGGTSTPLTGVASRKSAPAPVPSEPKTTPTPDEPKSTTRSTIVDITGLTVLDAVPIIREADKHTLDVWSKQEQKRDGGPRQTIVSAIDKRREEIAVESVNETK